MALEEHWRHGLGKDELSGSALDLAQSEILDWSMIP